MDSRREQEWKKFKEEAIQRLLRDKDIGYLDPDIWDLLDAFMKRDKAFTYSSCSGRITIIDAIYPWARKDSSVIYKNHLVLSEDELEGVLEKGQIRRLWLIVQGPILHVYTMDSDEAWSILGIARSVGFKHSGILTENKKGVLIELRTGIRLVHLLRETSNSKVEGAKELVKIANEILKKGKEKKDQLRNAILSSIRDYSMKLGENPEGNFHVHNNV